MAHVLHYTCADAPEEDSALRGSIHVEHETICYDMITICVTFYELG